jgi:hypothetical protein
MMTSTTRISFGIIASLLLLSTPYLSAADARNENADSAGKNPILTWNGPEYSWPKEALPQFTFERRVITDEEGRPVPSMHVVGGGVDIGFDDIRPFYIPEKPGNAPAEFEKSLILYDSHVATGMIAFTHFAKDAFFPELNKDAITGYAKTLVNKSNPQTGIAIDIIDGPTEPPRKQMILFCRPIMLTWKMTDSVKKTSITRTDMFVKMDDESIVVVSVLSDTASFSRVWAESLEVLRFSGFVKSGINSAGEK